MMPIWCGILLCVAGFVGGSYYYSGRLDEMQTVLLRQFREELEAALINSMHKNEIVNAELANTLNQLVQVLKQLEAKDITVGDKSPMTQDFTITTGTDVVKTTTEILKRMPTKVDHSHTAMLAKELTNLAINLCERDPKNPQIDLILRVLKHYQSEVWLLKKEVDYEVKDIAPKIDELEQRVIAARAKVDLENWHKRLDEIESQPTWMPKSLRGFYDPRRTWNDYWLSWTLPSKPEVKKPDAAADTASSTASSTASDTASDAASSKVSKSIFEEENFVSTVPHDKQLGFQFPGAPLQEGIISFHDDLMVFMIFIFTFVMFILGVCLYTFNFTKTKGISNNFAHGSLIEIIWTLIPAGILIVIAIPSFSLLYSIDEIVEPVFTVKVIGHQWYWTYEFLDSNAISTLMKKSVRFSVEESSFDSYMLSDEDFISRSQKMPTYRLLSTDNHLILPIEVNIRALVTSSDVIHAWALPALGIKIDACPGRLNQTSVYIKRKGLYFGQCSELCGVNHGFMPIAVYAFDSFCLNGSKFDYDYILPLIQEQFNQQFAI